jgi:pyruvate/2-oxoglutarate/acetoin dehydrogenase E1 component
MTVEAHKAAEVLAKRGVSVGVVDVRSIAPLDEETVLSAAARTGRVVVADYDWSYCGFGAELSARIHESCFGRLKKPVVRLGFAHAPCPTTRPLENLFYPSAVQIIRSVESLLDLDPMDLSGESFYTWENKFRGPF